jgi:Family of unknown function (DUF5681)
MAKDRKVRLEPPPATDEPSYEVGYRKPPAAARFKPGQSGNPRGRPKGARNKRPALNEERLKAIVIDEAYRTIKVSEGRRQITIPMAQAVIRALAVNAARGQLRSQQIFANLLSEVESANKALNDQSLETAIEYKAGWERELERRAKLGIKGPEPLPHPDDVIIDVRRGQVNIKGPMTKEEKVEWDRAYARVEECDREIVELRASLKLRKNKRYRQLIEDSIVHEKRIRQIIVDAFGEPKRRNAGGS